MFLHSLLRAWTISSSLKIILRRQRLVSTGSSLSLRLPSVLSLDKIISSRSSPIQLRFTMSLPTWVATFIRLKPYRRSLSPPQKTEFDNYRLYCLDGRCVQDPRTYSPRLADSQLLPIPTSWGRISAPNLN